MLYLIYIYIRSAYSNIKYRTNPIIERLSQVIEL
jgi:hypothetical protein